MAENVREVFEVEDWEVDLERETIHGRIVLIKPVDRDFLEDELIDKLKELMMLFLKEDEDAKEKYGGNVEEVEIEEIELDPDRDSYEGDEEIEFEAMYKVIKSE
ncbi:MAG: hypothetical protein ACTSXJ_09860 [Candidatus Baldrarchaeia archaeon]